MDVYNADVKNGTNVQVHPFNGSAAQQWYVTNLGGGEYRIMSNLNRSYSLDVNSWNNANGTNVQIWQTTNDKFKLRKEGGHYADGTPVNKHIIIPSFSDNHVLDVNRGSDPAKYDINVQIWHLANNNTNQYWEFYPYNAHNHASPDVLGLSAVVWRSNEYTNYPYPETISWWGYYYVDKSAADTWGKIIYPATGLIDALLAASDDTSEQINALVYTGQFSQSEISSIGLNFLVDLLCSYIGKSLQKAFYNNEVTAMKNSNAKGIQVEVYSCRLGDDCDVYTTPRVTGFSGGLVGDLYTQTNGVHTANGQFLEYQ